MDEPNWLAVLVPAPAAPASEERTPPRAVLSVAGPATPVPRPSMIVAVRMSGR